jgi:hypothetical protein
MKFTGTVAICLLSVVLMGCSGSAGSPQPTTAPQPPATAPAAIATQKPSAAPVVNATQTVPAAPAANTQKPPTTVSSGITPPGCPLTLPNGSTPPNENPSPLFYGGNGLWTSLWSKGQVNFGPGYPGEVAADGSLSIKWSWWRGTPGNLSIEGKRLDTSAPPLKVIVPDGFGTTGFQASTLVFPSLGCWQVTGKVGQSSLTFVTLIILNK